MSLNVLPELLETTIGTPAAAAARAIATSPSGSAARCSVIGAIPRGRSYVVPSRSVEVSTWRTSRRMRGATRMDCQAATASPTLISSRAPSAT